MAFGKVDRRPSKRKNRLESSDNLDLSAFLSVMMKLLPVMITMAAFVRYSIIDSSLTQISPAEQKKKIEEAKDKKRINLTLAITPDGYVLGSADKILRGEIVVAGNAPTTTTRIPKQKDGRFALQDLETYFAHMKTKYPDEDTVIVTAADSIRYEDIIDAMDAARFRLLEVPNAAKEKITMFPNVYIASRTIGSVGEGGR